MKTLLVVNLARFKGVEAILIERRVLDWTLERALEFPEVKEVLLVCPQALPFNFHSPKNLVVHHTPTQSDLLTLLKAKSQGFDVLYYIYGDCPFISPALAHKMIVNHTKYHADYTFAEGYPSGLAPEILSPSLLGPLLELAQGEILPWDQGELFALISKNINAFDIETELPSLDLRSLRIALNSSQSSHLASLESLWPQRNLEIDDFLSYIKNNQGLLRTIPTYFQLQITTQVIQKPIYSPLKQADTFFSHKEKQKVLPESQWKPLLKAISELSPGAVVNPSLWCEPSFYPNLGEFLTESIHLGLKPVIETSGLGWSSALLDTIPEGVDWIVELDTLNPEQYQSIRGDGWTEAQQCTMDLVQRFPGKVWPQMTRIVENANETLDFYKHWKEKAGQAIIQKYNHFSHRLPQLPLTDLSPIRRESCWHIKRDFVILYDGTVVMCKDDFERKNILGNVFTESLEKIWSRGRLLYQEQLQEKYQTLCKDCDEYYTFHF